MLLFGPAEFQNETIPCQLFIIRSQQVENNQDTSTLLLHFTMAHDMEMQHDKIYYVHSTPTLGMHSNNERTHTHIHSGYRVQQRRKSITRVSNYTFLKTRVKSSQLMTADQLY
jgi:hypothetical protein